MKLIPAWGWGERDCNLGGGGEELCLAWPIPEAQILRFVCHAYDHRLLQIASGCLTLSDYSETVCTSNKPLVSNSHTRGTIW
jgi:hypothetical protein